MLNRIATGSLFLFFVYSLQTPLQAQNTKADSLISVLESDKKDNSTIDALLTIADGMAKDGKLDEALKYSVFARRKSEQMEYRQGIAKSLAVSGATYKFKGDNQAALNDLEEAEVIYREVNDMTGLGRVHNHIASTYEDLSQFPKALEHHLLSIEFYKKSNKGEGITNGLIGAGIYYYKRGSYRVALEYYLQASKVADSLKAVGKKISVLNNLGVVYEALLDYEKALDYYSQATNLMQEQKLTPYAAKGYSNIAGIQIALGKFDEAKKNLDKAYRMRLAIGDKNQVYTLSNYGDLYKKLKKYDSAEYFYNQSLNLANEMNNLYGSLFAIRGFLELYTITGKLNKADREFERAHAIAKELNSKPWLQNIYQLKVKLDSAKGDYRSSLAYYKLYDHLNDSLFNFMVDEKIAYLESQRVKQNELASAQSLEKTESFSITKSQLIWAAIVATSIVVVLLIIFWFVARKYFKSAPKEIGVTG